MEHLYDKLKKYAETDYYGFHMPGHKRNHFLTGAELPYNIDITEIEGFDDLHHARGILKEAQEHAALLYHAGETHYLINGSTVGLLSAVLGCTHCGDKVLIARNCHKSVYNAVFLNHLYPVYIYPEKIGESDINGEIAPEQIEKLLNKNPDVKAVIITSPTYDGVISDIKKIAETAHNKGIPLILDEAHGAHLGFHPYFPANGNQCGADLVIHSLHKTLPSLTQTALLHMNGDFIDRTRVRKYLHMLQSSSPSYVLMAGIDECVRLLSEKGEKIFAEYSVHLNYVRKKLQGLRHMRLIETERYDPSKLVISVRNTVYADSDILFTGRRLCRCLLEDYHLQAEMAAGFYVVFITSPADTEEGFRRLISALYEMDQKLEFADQRNEFVAFSEKEKELISFSSVCGQKIDNTADKCVRQEIVLCPAEAEQKRGDGKETVTWEQAPGRIALEYTYLYPPGIPLIVPGERIAEQTVKKIKMYEKMGFDIEGTEKTGQIEVLLHG